jgi:hypothetical protein
MFFYNVRMRNIPKYYQKRIYHLVEGLKPEWLPEFKDFKAHSYQQ